MFDSARIKALTFDVFGTVVDWRESIIREGKALARAKGLDVDWAKFADAWRGLYQPAMNRVRRGEVAVDEARRPAPDEPRAAPRRVPHHAASPRPRSTISTAPGIGSIRGPTRCPV